MVKIRSKIKIGLRLVVRGVPTENFFSTVLDEFSILRGPIDIKKSFCMGNHDGICKNSSKKFPSIPPGHTGCWYQKGQKYPYQLPYPKKKVSI